ncbi:MAG: hypothetical protein K2P70_08060 [Hyphomonadaceae bacterium]|nr:hypothetical protein [Hyphomonadaceae bacterium]
MIMRSLIAAAVAFTALVTSVAVACPPPPPGPPQEVGESDEAYAQRQAEFRAAQEQQHQDWLHARQVRLWDEADSVIIARIERVRTEDLYYIGEVPRVTLRPLRTIKGRRYTNRFDLRYIEATSCGPIPAFDAIQGQVGDEFVIFLRGGRPSQRTVQQTNALTAITDARIAEAIAAH